MNSSDIASEQGDFTIRFHRLNALVETCKENANRHGERFNIFSILSMQRDETRTHSRFLAELLSPDGRHGEGGKFLQLFVRDVLGLPITLKGRITVTRELATTEDQRRVDIVVDSPSLIIGIEVKIDANDQPAQLRDYYKELSQRAKGRKTVALTYLTLDGKSPTNESLMDLNPENVHCLSFSQDIRQWIDSCACAIPQKPELSFALIQYKRLLESLTGTGTSMNSLIADRLSKNLSNMRSALDVEKALPKAKASIMLRFWEDLSNELGTALNETPIVYGGKNLKAISDNYFNNRRGGKHVGIKFQIGSFNNKKVMLYVNLFNAIHYGLRIDDENSAPSADAIKAKFQEMIDDGNAKANDHPSWLVCYYYNPAPQQEPIILNFQKFDEPVLAMIDDNTRATIIKNMVDHQANLVKKAKSLFETIDS